MLPNTNKIIIIISTQAVLKRVFKISHKLLKTYLYQEKVI